MSEQIETINADGYLKRNFLSIPTATAALTLQEAMKRSLEVYQQRKAKLDAYAKNPKADQAYLRECDRNLKADVDLYNYSLQLIDRIEVSEKNASLEFDTLNAQLIREMAENIKLINENVSLRCQLNALKANGAN